MEPATCFDDVHGPPLLLCSSRLRGTGRVGGDGVKSDKTTAHGQRGSRKGRASSISSLLLLRIPLFVVVIGGAITSVAVEARKGHPTGAGVMLLPPDMGVSHNMGLFAIKLPHGPPVCWGGSSASASNYHPLSSHCIEFESLFLMHALYFIYIL